MPQPSDSSTAPAVAKGFSRGKTLVTVETLVNEIIGTAAARAELVDQARKLIDKSTPRLSSRSGGKRHPRARLRETCINFFILRLKEMQDNGIDACVKPLLAAKGGNCRDAALLLYEKLKVIMAPPNSRTRSTVRSRVQKYLAFYAQSGTEIDRALADEGAPSTRAGDLEVYALAEILGIAKIDPMTRVNVTDTATTEVTNRNKINELSGLLGTSVDNPVEAGLLAESAAEATAAALSPEGAGADVQQTPGTASASPTFTTAPAGSPPAEAAAAGAQAATTSAAVGQERHSWTEEGTGAAAGLDRLARAALVAPPSTPTAAMLGSAARVARSAVTAAAASASAVLPHAARAAKRSAQALAPGRRPRLAAQGGLGHGIQGAQARAGSRTDAPTRLLQALTPLLDGALGTEGSLLAYRALALADFGVEHEDYVSQAVGAAEMLAIVEARGSGTAAHRRVVVSVLRRLVEAVPLNC